MGTSSGSGYGRVRFGYEGEFRGSPGQALGHYKKENRRRQVGVDDLFVVDHG